MPASHQAGFARRRLFPPAAACLLAAGALAGDAAAGPATSWYALRVQPILDRHCVSCHGPEKVRAELRLDSYAALHRGGAGGAVVQPGQPERSELLRRVTLPADHDDVMPSDGKPLLAPEQTGVLARWIKAGASPEAPPPPGEEPPAVAALRPAAPDYRPFLPRLAALQEEFGVRLVPVSQQPTDGLILRTVSAPARVDDAVLARIAASEIAPLIVDAELARTRVSDAALPALARFPNLARLDLARTAVTSTALGALAPLARLRSLNLAGTRIDATARDRLRQLPALEQLHVFGTPLADASP